MIQDIYKNTRPLHLGVGLLAILALLSGCSSDDSLPEDTTGAFLQPVFHMSGVETRSIISGTSTTERQYCEQQKKNVKEGQEITNT